METFPQSWVIVLDQLAREGKACNWSDMLAHQLKENVTLVAPYPYPFVQVLALSPE